MDDGKSRMVVVGNDAAFAFTSFALFDCVVWSIHVVCFMCEMMIG